MLGIKKKSAHVAPIDPFPRKGVVTPIAMRAQSRDPARLPCSRFLPLCHLHIPPPTRRRRAPTLTPPHKTAHGAEGRPDRQKR